MPLESEAPVVTELSRAARTVLTERRKEQLMARAADEAHEALYDAVGARTHLHLLAAADERSRQCWAEVSMPGRSVRPRSPVPNTRWIPPALVAAGTLILGVGFWIWNHKIQRLQAPDTTVDALPSALDTATFAASPVQAAMGVTAPEAPAAPPVQLAPSEAPPSNEARAEEPPSTASSLPASPFHEPPSNEARLDEPRPDATALGPSRSPSREEPSREEEPARSKPAAASDQGIFKDAPF